MKVNQEPIGTLLYEKRTKDLDRFYIVTKHYEDGGCELYSQLEQISYKVHLHMYSLEVIHRPDLGQYETN